MANTTTFKTQHDIPMDKMTFDRIADNSEFPKNNQKYLRSICAVIRYDEELQIASFSLWNPFSIEQGSEHYIITINDYRFNRLPEYYRLPKCYLISKRTGDHYRITFDQIRPYYNLMNGLIRVYNRSENELLEIDFISDDLKEEIKFHRRIYAYMNGEEDDDE